MASLRIFSDNFYKINQTRLVQLFTQLANKLETLLPVKPNQQEYPSSKPSSRLIIQSDQTQRTTPTQNPVETFGLKRNESELSDRKNRKNKSTTEKKINSGLSQPQAQVSVQPPDKIQSIPLSFQSNRSFESQKIKQAPTTKNLRKKTVSVLPDLEPSPVVSSNFKKINHKNSEVEIKSEPAPKETCPFCHKTLISVRQTQIKNENQKSYSVWCLRCMLETKKCSTPEAAFYLWNHHFLRPKV